MNTRTLIIPVASLVLLSTNEQHANCQEKQRPPNVILVVTDDKYDGPGEK